MKQVRMYGGSELYSEYC